MKEEKMQIKRFKLTAVSLNGYMMVVYQDNRFKSVLNEFEPKITEDQVNFLLKWIPDHPDKLIPLMGAKSGGKINVEAIKTIGTEPELPTSDYPTNKKIARFCEFYEAKTKLKYKVLPTDAGKITNLKATESEWENLMQTYYNSMNFIFLNKYSISNVVKYWNELRVEAMGTPTRKNYPIPYDAGYFKTLDMMQQREYWKVLRDAGYVFEDGNGREGKWVKKYDLTTSNK